jgi:cytochrome c-type biogenesis protein CcmE
MTPKKRRRLAFAAAILLASAGAAVLTLYALKDNVLYFYSPSDVAAKHVQPGVLFRIGGLVSPHSVERGPGADVRFSVNDGKLSIPVVFQCAVPGRSGRCGARRARFQRPIPGHRSARKAR